MNKMTHTIQIITSLFTIAKTRNNLNFYQSGAGQVDYDASIQWNTMLLKKEEKFITDGECILRHIE
jgi:hypothetical protein